MRLPRLWTVVLWTVLMVELAQVALTTLEVRAELNPTFMGYEDLVAMCFEGVTFVKRGESIIRSGSQVSEMLQKQCTEARKAEAIGYYTYIVTSVVRRTKWCLGYHCSLDVPVHYWYLSALGIFLRPDVVAQAWHWWTARHERRRNSFLAKKEMEAQREAAADSAYLGALMMRRD